MKSRMKLNVMLISRTGTYGLITVQEHCALLDMGFWNSVFYATWIIYHK